MGVNEVPSQLRRLCRQILENVWRWQPSSFGWNRWCAAIMSTRTCERCFPFLQNSRWLKLSHALLLTLLSQRVYVRELCVRQPLRLRAILLFASPTRLWQRLRKTERIWLSLLGGLAASDLRWLGYNSRGETWSERTIANKVIQLLRRAYPKNIHIISLSRQVSWSTIFAVEKPPAKSQKLCSSKIWRHTVCQWFVWTVLSN